MSGRLALTAIAATLLVTAPVFAGELHPPEERQLAEVRQLTRGGENAEAYWSPDGGELVFQSTAPPHECDQIFRLDAESGERRLVSSGEGRTTCAYFAAGGERVIYATTAFHDPACPPPPDRSQGYVWPLYDTYELVSVDLDGGDPARLTDNRFYDAEATVCGRDGSILFTSTRDGDLELYRMAADGSDVQRLTEIPGYDGGAFFSADCEKIVWRASRPRPGPELDDYRRLLERGLVRPGRLELWVANADGSEARQVTYLGAASFAPYFYPGGERILFSSNVGDPGGREFDLWAVDVAGTRLERVTHAPGFDGFPMFSPDGRRLAFASNRNQSKPGETDVYVARWQGREPEVVPSAADRLAADVAWLADDAREGRGVGTAGLDAAASWLAERFAELGLEPAGEEGYLQGFEVPVRVRAGAATRLEIDGEPVAPEDYVVASFSTDGEARGEVVAAGYGITAPEIGHDDYAGLDAKGKIVLLRRYTPPGETFEDAALRRRYGDLRYKAWNAREHGAAGVLIADVPLVAEGGEVPAESPLPGLRVEMRSDAGLPAAVLRRERAAPLFAGEHRARLVVELERERRPAQNVVGRIPGNGRHDGAVVVGAHYDHLGLGGPGSLEPDVAEPHNGADDNASGTAALLEIARRLGEHRGELGRDVYLVAFSGEESGLRGSVHFTRQPPPGLEMDDVAAMINLDMVGRLRQNRLSVLGSDSAEEWDALVPPLCEKAGLGCKLGGDGYGPSDQTPFYAAGVPVLHLFTGAHEDYHRPSDDAGLLNYAGLAQVAELTAAVAFEVAGRPDPLTHRAAAAPEPRGDERSYGASLGTIPEYADEGPGVLLSGTRPGSPADRAGLRRGDRLVELAGHEVRDIYDFMYVLRQARPGEAATAVVERGGERVEVEVVFGQSRGMR